MIGDYVVPRDEINYGDMLTIDEFNGMCDYDAIIDDDGYGHPVKDGFVDDSWKVYPSTRDIPIDATHILWFNR